MNIRSFLQSKDNRELLFHFINDRISLYCLILAVVRCKKDKSGNLIPKMYIPPFNDIFCYKCGGFVGVTKSGDDPKRMCGWCNKVAHTYCMKTERITYEREKRSCLLSDQIEKCYESFSYCEEHANKVTSVLTKRKEKGMRKVSLDELKQLRSSTLDLSPSSFRESVHLNRLGLDRDYARKIDKRDHPEKYKKPDHGEIGLKKLKLEKKK